MSDAEFDDTPTLPLSGVFVDVNKALQEVLKKALVADGVVHCLHQAAKDKCELCVLAENFYEPMYKKLVYLYIGSSHLYKHQIPLIEVDNNKKLEEWSGLCEIDSTGKLRKIVGCSCVVIRDYGEESPPLDVLREYLQNSK